MQELIYRKLYNKGVLVGWERQCGERFFHMPPKAIWFLDPTIKYDRYERVETDLVPFAVRHSRPRGKLL